MRLLFISFDISLSFLRSDDKSTCDEWAIIELQGDLETRQPVPLSGKFIGDLHFGQSVCIVQFYIVQLLYFINNKCDFFFIIEVKVGKFYKIIEIIILKYFEVKDT